MGKMANVKSQVWQKRVCYRPSCLPSTYFLQTPFVIIFIIILCHSTNAILKGGGNFQLWLYMQYLISVSLGNTR
ncbi:hypothetical protein XELAEV_18010544mg [Xenopus laevis]|uniref:Uncharacterized protein n=1 Tax=Xenopus laevis TaxID=8355 RepID=A0A974I1U9_XENLA|nr:hypothetical protein XELAEV_18010544mg [Xenopus laevis]